MARLKIRRGNSWEDISTITGPKGDPGPQGDPGPKGDAGDVSDVQMRGTSIVSEGEANIPFASAESPGVVQIYTSSFLPGAPDVYSWEHLICKYHEWDDDDDTVRIELAHPTLASTSGRGLMSKDDKVKLDGIANGAEVNVQSDWSEADSTADDFIKNKPTNVSAFANDVGYITGYTETDPVFTASAAYGISSSDISDWDDAFSGNIALDTSAVSGDDYNLTTILTAFGWLTDVIV